MGKHLHRLSDKDFESRTAICAIDGPVNIKVYGNTYRCEVAYRQHQFEMKQSRYGQQFFVKADVCAICGFKALDQVQMDRDHINGDKLDHRPENMQTLCSNCHRLKSWRPHLLPISGQTDSDYNNCVRVCPQAVHNRVEID